MVINAYTIGANLAGLTEEARAAEVERLKGQLDVAKICEVIAVEMKEQSEMDDLLAVVHEGNVNINYIYSSFGSTAGNPVLILHAVDMDETEVMLKNRGFNCLEQIGV